MRSFDRKTLTALLRRNANLIKVMQMQLRPYQSSLTRHEVVYTKLIVLGQGGPKAGLAAKKAA